MYNELYHHGIMGMKWGVRRYQNEDGTLTPAGQKRYGGHAERVNKKKLWRQMDATMSSNKNSTARKYSQEQLKLATKKANQTEIGKQKKRNGSFI